MRAANEWRQAILEAGKKYKVQVIYNGNMQEQDIQPGVGETVQLTFTFPTK